MGEHDCWLKHKPTALLRDCWHPCDGTGNVYDIHSIFVYEDDVIIKALPWDPEPWMNCKKNYDQDIESQFYAFVLNYIDEQMK